MKIGVFDSGIGGLSVADAIERAMPEHEIIFRDDVGHLPYGTKTPDEIFSYVVPILDDMVREGCQVLVIACNTVSTNLIGRLRERLTVPLVAVEPMVKPAAAATKSRVIAVCATPTTLASPRYAELKDIYARDITVLEPDCSTWTAMIESNTVDRDHITRTIDDVIENGADVIVLGCTHYHWIESLITEAAHGRATVIQPEPAVVRRLADVIADRALQL
ncbi:MAG TPA: glutamate racemase [Candidatus Saccharimonadales bacterium]|nr:glutamate racemase [Candidatus Saccharimonadales bacterium]